MFEICQTLNELWEQVDKITQSYLPKNNLKPIYGNGKTSRPKFMFVFINPTKANISSDKNWQGPRFPFIGTRPLWRVFHRAGMFDDELLHTINHSGRWSLDFTNTVLDFLKLQSFYFTNIVKWTGSDATLPDSEKVKLFLPILEREIELVQPRYIVTFGLIPFQSMTNQKIRLKDYYNDAIKEQKLKFFDYNGLKIIPCYFPVGRGDPKKAVEILTLANKIS